MTTNEYFKLTEDAGNLYRSKNYNESIACCYKIALEVESLKHQIQGFKELNKNFVWYTILNLFALDINNREIAQKTLEIILNSNILVKSSFKEELYQTIELEMDSSAILQKQDNMKYCIHYFQQLNLYNEKKEKELIKLLDETITNWNEYFRIKKDITSKILEITKGTVLSQKEIYKRIKDYDGRKILPVLKDLEKEKIIKREKNGNDYYISLI